VDINELAKAAAKYLALSQEWATQIRTRHNDRGYDPLLGEMAAAAHELQKALDALPK
jgi:hypothetical protein